MIVKIKAALTALLLLLVLAVPALADGPETTTDFVVPLGQSENTTPPPTGVPVQGVPGAYLVPPTTGSYSVNASGITTHGTVSFWWAPTEDQLGVWTIRIKVTDPGGLSDFEDVTITVYSGLDVNRDLAINVLDVVGVGQQFGETGDPGWLNEDVNEDGAVNVLDVINIAQAEWRDYNIQH